MVKASTGSDELVNVDNFVEIGDFSAVFGTLLNIWSVKIVEKSMYGFWFGKCKPSGSIGTDEKKGNLFDAE